MGASSANRGLPNLCWGEFSHQSESVSSRQSPPLRRPSFSPPALSSRPLLPLWSSRTAALNALDAMFAVLFMSSLAALLFVYVCLPAIWAALLEGDDSLDAYESGRILVSSRMSLLPSPPYLWRLMSQCVSRKSIPREWSASKHGEAHPVATKGATILQTHVMYPNRFVTDSDEQQQAAPKLIPFAPGFKIFQRSTVTPENVLDAVWTAVRSKTKLLTSVLLHLTTLVSSGHDPFLF